MCRTKVRQRGRDGQSPRKVVGPGVFRIVSPSVLFLSRGVVPNSRSLARVNSCAENESISREFRQPLLTVLRRPFCQLADCGFTDRRYLWSVDNRGTKGSAVSPIVERLPRDRVNPIHKDTLKNLLAPFRGFLAQLGQLAPTVSSEAAATKPADKEERPFNTELDHGVPKVRLLHGCCNVPTPLTAFTFTSLGEYEIVSRPQANFALPPVCTFDPKVLNSQADRGLAVCGPLP